MIIKASRIKAKSGPKALVSHVFAGKDNERISVLAGDANMIDMMFEDAKHYGDKFAVRHFVVSPSGLSGREVIKDALQELSREFGFDVRDVALVEHIKKRAKGDAERHWHIMVPERVPGQNVLSSSFMRPRHEKICRLLEMKHGEKITFGRHNRAVFHALKDAGNVEAAEKMSFATKVRLPEASFSDDQAQKAKRAGLKLSEIKAELSGKNAVDLGFALAKLESEGFKIEKGDKKGVVILKFGEEVIGNIARLSKTKIEDHIILASLADAKKRNALEAQRLARVEARKEKENHVQHIQEKGNRGEKNTGTSSTKTVDKEAIDKANRGYDVETTGKADRKSDRRNTDVEKQYFSALGNIESDSFTKSKWDVSNRGIIGENSSRSDSDRSKIVGNRNNDERVAENIQTYACLIAQNKLEKKASVLLENFSMELDTIADTPPLELEASFAASFVNILRQMKAAALVIFEASRFRLG